MKSLRYRRNIADLFSLCLPMVISFFLFLFVPLKGYGQDALTAHYARFYEGAGPSCAEGVYRLLDPRAAREQANTIGFDIDREGAFERLRLRANVLVLSGGSGGGVAFLNTAEYGRRGPAPFAESWVAPNLRGTFAVGIDVHNPLSKDARAFPGESQGRPGREISLHWNGREIARRVSPVEFRDELREWEITVQHVIGGAEITVRIGGESVYERYFIAGMLPYEARLAFGAEASKERPSRFEIRNLDYRKNQLAKPPRTPKRVELFNHVMIKSSMTSYRKEARLPPRGWAFGRIVLTLEIHDAGPHWDEWDRAGHLYVVDEHGIKRDIAPFVTSFRTPCHWSVDVTHFRPWLSGAAQFFVEVKSDFPNDRGFMMSASLDFYHGTPTLEPYRIIPLWNGTAQYGSATAPFPGFFTPKTVSIDPITKAARLYVTTTGHSPVGEFTPAKRTVTLSPDKIGHPSQIYHFENLLWRNDCYLNPTRPQFGTWKFSRAGWAPGDIVRPWWLDLTPYLVAGKVAELNYIPEPYDFADKHSEHRPDQASISQATHIIRSYLILYRSTRNLRPAPFLEVIGIEKNSVASEAGIREGDYLVSYNGKSVRTIEELRSEIQKAATENEAPISMSLYRGDERLELSLDAGRLGVLLAEEELDE